MASLIAGVADAADSVTGAWETTLQQAAMVKEGMERFRHPQYQYECLGLGGTVVRVGTDGFTLPGAGVTNTGGWLKHLPYLTYQYWWDEEGHRHLPFDLTAGYGKNLEPGQVTAFKHHLDIASGRLTIDLGLTVGPAGAAFQSHREMFVTPEGVLVIRITDSPDAPLPIQMRVGINREVRVYLNAGVYKKEHDPWAGAGVQQPGGLVVVAKRPKSCTATLAIACEAADPLVDTPTFLLGCAEPGRPLTLYIAPGSSYASTDPVAAAWTKAETARKRGFDVSRKETAQWWKDFHARSAVSLPDRDLATWYARSMYYLGVFFGNTDVPPGCNGTSIESFAGAVCPEYDLVLDQRALLYGNHFDEARRVVGWLERTLPRAERYAKEGLTLQKTSVKYSGGAKYGTIMSYDGTIPEPPSEGEGFWAYEDFAGNNAALMALDYVDWSGDRRYDKVALRILKETTQVSVEDLQWRPDFNAYLNKTMPNTVQQAATLYGLRESVRRGVAEKGWADMAGKVLLPTADYQGTKVLTGGAGATPVANSGDATWLIPLWWYRILADDDPLVRNSYALFRTSKTGDYVFNNGWMGVFAAKLHDGDEACHWAKQMLRPGVTLFDDTCIGEIVNDFEDFKKTPEVAAHGALICNLTQMLLDPDDEKSITVFPAIPAAWERQGVGFVNLAAKGSILVSAEFKPRQVRVILDNRSDRICRRDLRVRLPKGTSTLRLPVKGVRLEDGWAVLSAVELPPKGNVELTLEL
ncbi:MAG: hypothetical protein NTW21_06060 [Verrucomicrobia bacterium]|nr:hypothetical protein [Verrucomicrobiota bacterium]